MISPPSVTIGITCFNAEESIERCVESALNQNYSNFNIIVVDDFSSDSSYDRLLGFCSPIITLIRNPVNLGCSSSRNLIVSRSVSDLICFLDDDDVCHPDRVTLQVQSLLDFGVQSQPYIVSVPSMIRKYPSGYIKYFPALGTSGISPTSFQLIDYLLFNRRVNGVDYGYCCPTSSFMTTRQLLLDAGLFDPSMKRVEDNDIVIRFCLLSCRFVGINEVLLYQSSSFSSYKSYRINLLSELRLIRKNKLYLNNCHMYRYSRLSTFLRYFYFTRRLDLFVLYFISLFLDKPLYCLKHYARTFLRRGLHDFRIRFG